MYNSGIWPFNTKFNLHSLNYLSHKLNNFCASNIVNLHTSNNALKFQFRPDWIYIECHI